MRVVVVVRTGVVKVLVEGIGEGVVELGEIMGGEEGVVKGTGVVSMVEERVAAVVLVLGVVSLVVVVGVEVVAVVVVVEEQHSSKK